MGGKFHQKLPYHHQKNPKCYIKVSQHQKGAMSHHPSETSHHEKVLSSMERCHIIFPSATSSSKGLTSFIEGATSHQAIIIMHASPIINAPKVTPTCAKVSREWSHVIKIPNFLLGVSNDLPQVVGTASIKVG
jgi:hypothetical protein